MPLNFVAKAAITAGLMVANMALSMTRKIEGPRLDNLKFTSGDYGAPLPMIWGMRRMEVPIFQGDDLTEIKRRRKTKGGKFNEYTYYGTWAVALAGHEIQAVSRIWFDTHLIYDATGAGPLTPFDFGGANIVENIAIFLGTETQLPDPRMQAAIEAKHGEGSCPAYRGTAYIYFKDIPLEKLGNRIPQVSVEILGAAGDAYPSSSITLGGGSTGQFAFSPDYSTFVAGGSGKSIFDTATRTRLVLIDPDPQVSDLADSVGYLADGRIIASHNTHATIYAYDFSGNGTEYFDIPGQAIQVVMTLTDSDGDEHWFADHNGGADFYFDGTAYDASDVIGSGFTGCSMFHTTDGEVWAIGRSSSSNDTSCILWQLKGGSQTYSFDLPNSADFDPIAFHFQDGAVDHFVIGHGNHVYAVDRAAGVLTETLAVDYPAGIFFSAFRAVAPDSATFWVGFEEIDSATLSRTRLLDVRDWDDELPSRHVGTIYDPINHALIYQNLGGSTTVWYYLDRVAANGVLLSVIAGDVADMVGIETHDFSDLDQEITGWSTTRGQASNMLEPLFDAYDSDIRPHDFGTEGIKRTGVATGSTLATAWFTGEPRYSVKVRQAAELPRALLVDFADIDADQQPNTARADRPFDATDAVGEMKIDLTTLALDPDEAIQLTNRHLRRRWNERQEVTTALTAKELKLEPGDVRTLELDGETRSYRCVNLTIRADDTLATEWRYDHPSLATLDGSAGATFDGRNPSVVVVAVLSKGFVLDIPLLHDADDATPPQVYPLAAPYADGAWPGATIYQAVDGEYSEELSSQASSEAATWGYVTEELPYANPNLWDRGTEITVTLQTGELTGCTEAAANADPMLNLVAIGAPGRWEIVQVCQSTLIAPRTYTCRVMKRGRRGTEWAAELHAAGDTFVLLDNADPVAMGLSEVSTAVSFKAITGGRSTGFPFGYTYQGQSLMPYAPVHLEAVKESNGDWTLTWVRRTRVGGAWTGGSTIPLSEASEEYELTVGDGVSSDTKTVASATTYTWTVAAQTTDTGAEVMAGDLEWSVAQVSDAVGAGFLAEATA